MPDATVQGPGREGRPGRLRPREVLRWLAPPAVRRPLWLAFVAGGLGALGLAPFDWWPLSILALAGVAWLAMRAPNLRSALWTGWAAGFGWLLVALHWLVEPFLVDAARHGWMAPFAPLLLSGWLATWWGAAFGLVQILAPPGPWRLPLAVAALTLAEIMRGIAFTGFPWGLIGHTLTGSPFLPLAAWIGPDGLSVVVLSAAAGLALAADALRRGRLGRAALSGGAVAMAGAALFAALPVLRNAPPATPADAPVIRVLQPNAPQDEKWDPRMITVFFDRLLTFSAEPPALDGRAPALVVWPETSVPAFLDDAGYLLEIIGGQARGAISAVGIDRREDRSYWNNLAVVAPDGALRDVYEKHHLVPFGEFMPLGDLFALVGIGGLASWDGGGYTAGAGPAVLDLGAAGRGMPLICYEMVFPRLVNAAPERPDFLLQITNDAWFGGFAGPRQHLAQARLRAVEQGLPVIRSANTGISAVIDARGETVDSLPLNEAGWMDVPRPAAAPATLYSRVGGWPVTLLVLATLLAALPHRLSAGRRASY